MVLGDLLQPIFKTPDAANLATLPVAAGLISFTLLAAGLMDQAGRVKLLLISAVGRLYRTNIIILSVLFDTGSASIIVTGAEHCEPDERR